ncbi:hypothetical protein TBLA_0A08880 [Henningerozyma blattae CBS 6284]|uniref:AB hydrolase-1 domain-containing protein n=1 Tax=Henningerozyma blattae (strain ATCC 34711 / CBS 6284 / DSM 70876 / NBRC 10599 / NRRL Y-10934 / UCD 77-7) TaxID=1071380 RepID=I2GX25_HENB6|nr:hypothetical protein TBLA_0A08880 [Tetrapisispora blattae CBS 6284]CCH58677.1 hypothetical protein TBLA_0A08880 [Tetrapisispora blattae CBS 6284]
MKAISTLLKQHPSVPLNYTILRNRSSFYHQAESNTPPIVILHGLFGNSKNNRTLGRKLHELMNTTVYLPDLRNHGETQHELPHTYEAMVTDVKRFIEEKIKKPSLVVGHSMGGKVALGTALTCPEWVRGVVSIDMGATTTNAVRELGKYSQGMLDLEGRKFNNRRELQQVMAEEVVPDPFVRGFLMNNLELDQKGVVRGKCDLAALHGAITDGTLADWPFTSPPYLATRVPTLLLLGTRSEYSRDADNVSQLTAKQFPNLQTNLIEGSHYINAEQPVTCAETISNWARAALEPLSPSLPQ